MFRGFFACFMVLAASIGPCKVLGQSVVHKDSLITRELDPVIVTATRNERRMGGATYARFLD